MPVEVLPAVLAMTDEQLADRLRLARRLNHKIHLDVMDGKFVPTRSVGPKIVRQLRPGQIAELHCMVKNPIHWWPVIKKIKIPRVIIHIELGPDLGQQVVFFRRRRRQVFFAINPKTPIKKLLPWIPLVQGVVVMGVRPGHYHGRWQRSTIRRIAQLKDQYPELLVAYDGGITPATVPAVVKAGAKQVIVGSYLQFHRQPNLAWQNIHRLAAGRKK